MPIDTESLILRSSRLELDGLDFSAFADRPLDGASLRCLRYMHDVESHTMCYLRDVLVTRAHTDPELTAFLACWCYEEHWHGEALSKILSVHGEASGKPRIAEMRRRLPRRDYFRPIAYIVGSAISRHMVTVQMTWGAINEWTTQSGYGRLARRADHPVLTELLKRIMKQEGRHIDFYASQARQRLEGCPTAQRVTRKILGRWWSPVGAGVMPRGEVSFLAGHLFGGSEGAAAAARIDRQIDRLPGLDGLHLVERAVKVAGSASAGGTVTGPGTDRAA